MTRPRLRLTLPLLATACALAASGCGEQSITVAKNSPLYAGARTFNQRCSGCHTFHAAGTEGSATSIHSREYKDGPNFNQRVEKYQDVLYAIRNGGFSSGPMPQDIVVGKQAQQVACFVATYSGQDAQRAPSPNAQASPGSETQGCKQQLASSK